MVRFALVVVPVLALAGCKTESAPFCAAHPGEDGCAGDGSVGGACSSNADCTDAAHPACNTDQGRCAQCFARDPHNFCTSAAPHCDVDTCTACVDDGDCGTSVCLAGGACADPASVIHAVSSGGLDQAPCGAAGASPCTLDTALKMTNATRNVIKLDDAGPYAAETGNFVADANLTLDMRGAVMQRNADGPILTINGNRTVTVLGGTIRGAQGGMAHGVQCKPGATLVIDQTVVTLNDQSAIDASMCALQVTRAKITNNNNQGGAQFPGINVNGGAITLARTWLDTNRGGGINIINNAKFILVGNVFASNGDPTGGIGGININSTAVNPNRLEFNTVVENKAQNAIAAGIACTANAGFVAANNIVWSNNSLVSGGIQVFGGCGYRYSDIGPMGITGTINVANNSNVDPKLMDNATNPRPTPMTPISMLGADPAADLTGLAAKDIDGNPRVAPVNIGAFQYKPPGGL